MASFVRIDFLLPDLGPPSTEIPVYYSILFKDADKNHRGQVLIERNDTAGIEANEPQFSAIFGPGKELQEIKLGQNSLVRILFAISCVMGCGIYG